MLIQYKHVLSAQYSVLLLLSNNNLEQLHSCLASCVYYLTFRDKKKKGFSGIEGHSFNQGQLA